MSQPAAGLWGQLVAEDGTFDESNRDYPSELKPTVIPGVDLPGDTFDRPPITLDPCSTFDQWASKRCTAVQSSLPSCAAFEECAKKASARINAACISYSPTPVTNLGALEGNCNVATRSVFAGCGVTDYPAVPPGAALPGWNSKVWPLPGDLDGPVPLGLQAN